MSLYLNGYVKICETTGCPLWNTFSQSDGDLNGRVGWRPVDIICGPTTTTSSTSTSSTTTTTTTCAALTISVTNQTTSGFTLTWPDIGGSFQYVLNPVITCDNQAGWTLTTNHSVTFSGLTSGTIYCFLVRSLKGNCLAATPTAVSTLAITSTTTTTTTTNPPAKRIRVILRNNNSSDVVLESSAATSPVIIYSIPSPGTNFVASTTTTMGEVNWSSNATTFSIQNDNIFGITVTVDYSQDGGSTYSPLNNYDLTTQFSNHTNAYSTPPATSGLLSILRATISNYTPPTTTTTTTTSTSTTTTSTTSTTSTTTTTTTTLAATFAIVMDNVDPSILVSFDTVGTATPIGTQYYSNVTPSTGPINLPHGSNFTAYFGPQLDSAAQIFVQNQGLLNYRVDVSYSIDNGSTYTPILWYGLNAGDTRTDIYATPFPAPGMLSILKLDFKLCC